MAIIRGTGIGKGNRTGFKPISNAGAGAAASGAAIGGVIAQTGKKILAVQDAYMKEAQAATSSAQYNDALSKATVEFNKGYGDRLNKTTDDKGNPTYSSLVGDVEELGNQAMSKYAEGIQDPAARAKFEATFIRNVGNKQIQAGGQARKQHQDFVKASLNKGLQTQIQGALTDDIANVNQYNAEAHEMIDAAVNDGAITFTEAGKLRKSVSSSIRVSGYQRMIDNDPKAALMAIQGDGASLGITSDEKKKLTARAESAIRSAEFRAKLDERALTDKEKLQQQVEENKMSLQVEEGSLTEDKVMAAVDDNLITVAQGKTLLKQLTRVEKEQIKAFKIRDAIDANLKAGVAPTGVTPKQVDDHFKRAAEGVEADTISKRAPLAAKYRAPVKSFTGDLSAAAQTGDAQKSADALSAYSFVKAKAPEVISKLPAKDRAVYSAAQVIADSTTLSGGEAMDLARKKVYDVEEDVIRERRREFSKIKGFKSDKMQDTVNEVFDLDGWFSREANITPGTSAVMRRLFREAYELTGDEDAAKQYVKDWSEDKYGVSNFNGTKEFMLLPPSKAVPGVDDEELRQVLESEVAGVLPAGVDASSVMIESDSLTSRTGDPSYGVYVTKDIGGVEIREPLINETTQEPIRWSPDKQNIYNEKAAEAKNAVDKIIEDARAVRTKILENDTTRGVPTEIPRNFVSGGVERVTGVAARTGSTHRDLAKSFLGYDENRHTEALSGFFEKSLGKKINPAKTAWCAAFVNSVAQAHGITGTGSLMARSFLKWGTPTQQPTKGDVVVFSRKGKHSAFGHVGFFEGFDANGDIRVLGGNQGNRVSIKTYSKDKLLGYRVPPKAQEIADQHGDK